MLNATALERAQDFYSNFAIDEINLTLRNSVHLHIWPPIVGALYVAMVMLLPGYLVRNKMTNLAPKVKPWMQAWNLFLSLLSVGMFFGITGPLYQFWNSYGTWGIICDEPRNFCQPGVFVIWLAIFCYSKIFEMVDTLLLILKVRFYSISFFFIIFFATSRSFNLILKKLSHILSIFFRIPSDLYLSCTGITICR